MPEPTSRPGRDIYFLIFDRYGSADAIERRFDITDNDLYGWLEERGFQVPANSHANYRATDFSLAATLNMRFLDDLTRDVGPALRRPNAGAGHDPGPRGRPLPEVAGLSLLPDRSWFGPTRSIAIADENLSYGVASEFETVLNDLTIMPAIDRVRGVVSAEPTERDRHREGALFGLRQLRRVATAPGPKFVFAHILLPHDPYVFKADGSRCPKRRQRPRLSGSSTPTTSRLRTRRSRTSSGTCWPAPRRPDRS